MTPSFKKKERTKKERRINQQNVIHPLPQSSHLHHPPQDPRPASLVPGTPPGTGPAPPPGRTVPGDGDGDGRTLSVRAASFAIGVCRLVYYLNPLFIPWWPRPKHTHTHTHTIQLHTILTVNKKKKPPTSPPKPLKANSTSTSTSATAGRFSSRTRRTLRPFARRSWAPSRSSRMSLMRGGWRWLDWYFFSSFFLIYKYIYIYIYILYTNC